MICTAGFADGPPVRGSIFAADLLDASHAFVMCLLHPAVATGGLTASFPT